MIRRDHLDTVSRSEAKRLVARLPEFRHVTLEFSGVDVVGQGFCDEVFRVFAHAHADVGLEPVGMNDTVAFMVARARAAAATTGHWQPLNASIHVATRSVAASST